MVNRDEQTSFDFAKVSTCKIHPEIGIARVGNAPDEFFIGPEVPGYLPPKGGYKDAHGRVKRQAARFRIYAYDKNERILGELPICGTGEDAISGAQVTWSVHLANKKAAGHEFDAYEPSANYRNPGVDRAQLTIDPGSRTIAGQRVSGEGYRFDSGRMRGKLVPLGEIRTDEQGRLIVLGGYGTSGAVVPGDPNPDRPIQDYANNDDWYDDVSDGPVTASVLLPGREGALKLEGANAAWVIVAPPKFAPAVHPVVTLYDVVRDTAIRAGWENDHTGVEYFRDIYPILLRAADTAWVNERARIGHGYGKVAHYSRDYPGAPENLTIRELLSAPALASPERVRALRAGSDRGQTDVAQRIFYRLREPLPLGPTPGLPGEQVKPPDTVEEDPARIKQATSAFMPSLSGDGGGAKIGKPKTWLSLLSRQYDKFKRWSEGDFTTGAEETWASWEEMTPERQVEALRRAALEPCSGGAFLPGIEMTYIARWKRTFCAAFRINHKANGPGDLTKYMAVPWQADFYDCKNHWWPAQRPDEVIPLEVFEEADKAWRAGEKVAPVSEALEGRMKWDRGLGGNTLFRRPWRDPFGLALDDPRRSGVFARDDMIRYWSELGFVVPLRATSGEVVHVEVERRPFAGMDARLLFHALLNVDKLGNCRPKAKEYVERVLAAARELQHSPLAFALRPFRYNAATFEARMQDIYDDSADFGFFAQTTPPEPYDANNKTKMHNPYFRTRKQVTYRIRQLTPFNFLDGAWLRNIHRLGPVDEVNSILFFIAKEELGDGVPSQNHANVYRDLCHSFGFYPPPVASSAFAGDPGFLDAAFDSATFQLAISEFTEDYYPEIIGMSLWLEWTVLDLHRIAAIVERVGLSPHFYRMHIAIDNADNGHGAGIVRAVKIYLQQVKEAGGEQAVQCHWQRIWDGYVAFSYTFSALIEQIKLVLRNEKKEKENHPQWLRNRLMQLIRKKKTYGQSNHTRNKLGKESINHMFDDPEGFLNKLVEENWIVPGKPDESPFFELLEFQGGRRRRPISATQDVEFEGGRMYNVFTHEEIQLWRDWTLAATETKRKLASEKVAELLAVADPDVVRPLARSAGGGLEVAASDERIALWQQITEARTEKERAAAAEVLPSELATRNVRAIVSRAEQWLGWSMLRAVLHLANHEWRDLGRDGPTVADATGQLRTHADCLALVRSSASPPEAARAYLAALKTECQKHYDRSRAEVPASLIEVPALGAGHGSRRPRKRRQAAL